MKHLHFPKVVRMFTMQLFQFICVMQSSVRRTLYSVEDSDKLGPDLFL